MVVEPIYALPGVVESTLLTASVFVLIFGIVLKGSATSAGTDHEIKSKKIRADATILASVVIFLVPGLPLVVNAGRWAIESIIGVGIGLDLPFWDAPRNPEPTPEPSSDVDWTVFGVIALVVVGLTALGLIIGGLISLHNKRAENAEADRLLAEKRQTELDRIVERHDALLEKWMEHTDWDLGLVLRYPLLGRVEEPAVASHLRAVEKARDLRVESQSEIDGDIIGSTYDDAVSELGRAWTYALEQARLVNASMMTREERRLLKEARGAWAIVSNTAATDQERATYAGRLEKLMRRLRLASEERTPQMLHALEQAKSGQRMLTSAHHTGQDDDETVVPTPTVADTAKIAAQRARNRVGALLTKITERN